MIRKLALPLFVVGIAFYGCSDDKKSTSADASASGGSGGSAGSAGSGGTAGRGGAGGTAGSGGSSGSGGSAGSGGMGGSAGTGGMRDAGAAGMGGSAGTAGRDGGTADAARDGGGGATGDAGMGGSVNWMQCMDGMKPGVSAQDFCAYYQTICTFGGAMRYTDMGDCMMKYNAASTNQKSCRAGHVCFAGSMTSQDYRNTHCPHATGLGLCN